MWISEVSDWFTRRRMLVGQALALVLCSFFYMSAFPPFDVSEAAFVFIIPMLLWLRMKPSYKAVAWTSLAIGWLVWLVLIFWLRHVTIIGMVLLAGIVGAHFMIWSLGAAWLSRRFASENSWLGLPLALGVAALWVIVEHLRTWIFTGFPWLPLAASQWEHPIMLQSAAYFGSWGLSFSLIFLNAGIAGYLVRIVRYAKDRSSKAVCPEFYVSLICFAWMTFVMGKEIAGQDREDLFNAAVLQPAIPQQLKWDENFFRETLEIVERNSLLLKPAQPDVLFWPEAVIPDALKGYDLLETWANLLADKLGFPIFAGAFAIDEDNEDVWYNSVLLVRPEHGFFPKYYSKRHLVPFGEYIPFRESWPWIETIVPLESDVYPGREALSLPLNLPDRTIQIGPLICYEDVFPGLVRESVDEGAAMLFVSTNSAWYGKSAAARQHMTHSVLRAVENRRIVVRASNDGWSGWIDEYGRVRGELVDEDGSMWIRGGANWNLDRDKRWKGVKTFYTKRGDWFVWLNYGLLVLLVIFAGWMPDSLRKASPNSRLS